MPQDDDTPARVRWARLRLQIIGTLLASPPEAGELKAQIEALAARPWRHPTTGEVERYSFKTIERWFYAARGEQDPVTVLARKIPAHAGTHPTVSAALGEAIIKQHREHPRWTYKLHHDNLIVVVREDPSLGPIPGYATVRRYMKDRGLFRGRRQRSRKHEETFELRERRSFEVTHVHGLWHLDFHEGSRRVPTSSGELKKPKLLGILDDHSRLCCHMQWYFDEDTESLVHALMQAFAKRGLPRGILSDNGSAMVAAETTEGLERLGIAHHTTLPATPEQNGKQECFWGQIEGRLLPMLEGEPVLTLDLLNAASQAWVEQEYHRTTHSEIKETPLARYLRGPSVGRECPESDALRRVMRTEVTRTQRRSDGTTTVEGVRYEIPSAYRALVKLRIRVARWDLSSVDLVDPRSGQHLATLLPLDKAKNAERMRRVVGEATPHVAEPPKVGIAPLLRSLMAEYAATGFPPAFVPKGERKTRDDPPEDEDS